MSKQSKTKTFKSLEAAQRELDIQMALEGIRKLALAMQTTEDIGPVVSETRAALNDLGIWPFRTAIALCDESVDSSRSWSAKQTLKFNYNGEGSLLVLRKLGSVMYAPRPKHKHWVMAKMNKRQLTSEFRKFRKSYQMRGVTLPDDYLEHMVGESPIPYYSHNFHFAGGFIAIGMDRELGRDEVAIARRIAEAFGFAYKRLLELEEKEQRLREAEIEVALERVRATALGMQHSNEITTVAKAVYDSYVQLGYEIMHVGIMVIDQTKPNAPILNMWGADEMTPDGAENESRVYTPNLKDFAPALKGESYTHPRTSTKVQWQAQMKQLWTKRGIARSDIKAQMKAIPERVYSNFVSIGNGVISIDTGAAFTDEDFAIGRRFADVFRVAHKRFQELEEKEEQNRELTIQNALERVRARALGMQESDSLESVTVVLHEQFVSLGIPTIITVIEVVDPENEWVRTSSYMPASGSSPWMTVPFETYKAEPTSARTLEAYERGDTSFTFQELEGDEYWDYLKFWLDKSGVEGKRSDYPDRQNAVAVYFARGWIYLEIVEGDPLSEDDIGMVKRFGDMFDFAYDRFLELRDKEERAREAELQASVDRVRAEAMAMAATDDIANVVKALWEGLVRQTITFDTLVFRVEDAQTEELQMYVATLEGASGVAFPESRFLSRGMLDGVNLYRSTMSLEMAQLDFQEHRGLYAGVQEEVNEEVRAATAMKSQFLANMSHELRTPMNAIIGFTRLVLRRSDNLADRQRENLEKVSLSANHLLTLINDILDLSKVEAGKVDLKPTDFNLPLLLEGCCATVGPTLGKPTVELVCKMDEGVGEIYGDEDRLRQVMTNLLSNALKFTDEGLVTVTARRQNTGDRIQEGVKGDSQKQMLEIAVSDTGIGIPEDMLGLVFEEFRQVAGGTIVRQKGTGLGLAITKRLIELMGGTIGVKSEVGKGSVFTVEIPLVYEEGKGQSYLAA